MSLPISLCPMCGLPTEGEYLELCNCDGEFVRCAVCRRLFWMDDEEVQMAELKLCSEKCAKELFS